MEFTRFEIIPGVFLNHVRLPSACVNQCISLNLLTRLERDNAGLNALLPHVLCRGTGLCCATSALELQAKALGVTLTEPVTRGFGEIQTTGVRVSFTRSANIEEVCRFAASLLLTPATKGGLLLPAYVDEEKAALAAVLDAAEEAPLPYALQRCREEMCCYEDYGVNPLGDAESVENAHYKSFTRYYRSLLQCSPVEIICCTTAKAPVVKAALRDAFALTARGEIDYDLGTDIRMNSVEDTVRAMTEDHPAGVSVLVEGYRLGDSMEDPDSALLLLTEELILTALKGAGEASTVLDLHKGVLFLALQVQDRAAAEEAIENGFTYLRESLTTADFAAAKLQLRKRLISLCSDAASLEAFSLSQVLFGLGYGPEEMAALVEEVSGPEVAAAINALEKDYVFFLNGVNA